MAKTQAPAAGSAALPKNPSLTMRFQDNFEAECTLRRARQHVAQEHSRIAVDGLQVWDATGLLAASLIDAKLIALHAEFAELEAELKARRATHLRAMAGAR